MSELRRNETGFDGGSGATPDAAIEAVQDAVRGAAAEGRRLRVAGGESKPALSRDANLSTRDLRGVVEYEPAEYTVTVRAGTPVQVVRELLAGEGQHLPFDPPLGLAGATLGGTVAAGLSGPGRFRYGGVRDFLLGVRFVDGKGDLHVGGGRVVKNAAGFDLPKLMVGALGRFGVLTELTFKVFPAPEAHATMTLHFGGIDRALEIMQKLARSSLELSCLELLPPGTLLLRVGGMADALDARLERIRLVVGVDGEVTRGAAEAQIWEDARELAWAPEEHALVRVPLVPPRLGQLEDALARADQEAGQGVPRRYGVGGHVAWIAWPETIEAERLRTLLAAPGLPGLVLRGETFGSGREDVRIGPRGGGAFLERIASVLDPNGIFAPEEPRRPRAA